MPSEDSNADNNHSNSPDYQHEWSDELFNEIQGDILDAVKRSTTFLELQKACWSGLEALEDTHD